MSVAAIYGLSHTISLDEEPADLTQIEGGADAPQPAGNPGPYLGTKGGPNKPVSFHDLGNSGGGVMTPQTEQKVSLDTDTKSILQQAARNARASIFKSTGTQPEKKSDVPAE